MEGARLLLACFLPPLALSKPSPGLGDKGELH